MYGNKKYYHHIAIDENGKVCEFRCERFPDGRYNLQTMERIEITDKQFIEWYKHHYEEV